MVFLEQYFSRESISAAIGGNMHNRNRAVGIITTAALVSFVTSLALAQNAETAVAPEAKLAEVVVTATKVGQVSVQALPVTIQVVGENEIATGEMQGFNDYSKLIPGLASLNKGPDQTQIMIRGIT